MSDIEADRLERRTACEIEDIGNIWNIDEMDASSELRDAIQTVRNDHEESVLVNLGPPWYGKVQWNENTDSVWVGIYGYEGGFKVVESE